MKMFLFIFLFILWLIISISTYLNRIKIINKYDVGPIISPLTGLSLLSLIVLIIKLMNNNISDLLNENSEFMGAIIGIIFWFIIAAIFFFSTGSKKDFSFYIGKLFYTLCFTFAFPVFLIFSLSGGFGKAVKYVGKSNGSSGYGTTSSRNTSTNNNNYSSSSKSEKTCHFIDSLGYQRTLGDSFYDGSKTLRQYGEPFIDSLGNYRYFGNDYYDASGTLRRYGDPFIDGANILRYFRQK